MIDTFGPYRPDIDPTAHIFENAAVIGRVRIGRNVSVWPGSVLRADVDAVEIGDDTNLQDGVLVHVSPGLPATVGRGVTVGHGAILHGCRVGANCLVGMGAILLDGVEIGDDCVIGAGSVVTERTRIPSGSLALGTPARVVRPLTPDEIEKNRRSAREYAELARTYRRGHPGGR